MANLPIFNTDNKSLSLMQTAWAQMLNALLRNPRSKSSILTEVSLTAGSNSINHLLGRKLQGWSISRQRAAASIYDTQDSNLHADLTLTLVASAPVIVDLEVW